MATRLDLDTAEIVRLYVEEGLRGAEIARRMGCSETPIYARLSEAGVSVSRLSRLDRDEVTQLYLGDSLSLEAIGERCGCSHQTVARHLRMWGVPLRTHAEALQPAGRRPAPQSLELRGYALGFTWGDLAVDVQRGEGMTVSVRGSTTHSCQVELVRNLFEPYGRVTVSVGERSTCVRASLDQSFAFLREKYGDEVPAWVAGPSTMAAFAAGYIDAEGSFGVYASRGRFKLDSYDEDVHRWLGGWCEQIGVIVRQRIVGEVGVTPAGIARNGRLWRTNVNEGLSLLRLIATIEPFSRHARRRATMVAVSDNVSRRLAARALRPLAAP